MNRHKSFYKRGAHRRPYYVICSRSLHKGTGAFRIAFAKDSVTAKQERAEKRPKQNLKN